MAGKSKSAAAKTAAPVLSALDKLKKGASRKAETTKGKDDRPTIVIDTIANPQFKDFVELSTLIGELAPTKEQREKSVKAHLFDLFTKDWFEKQRPPENPRIIIRKYDENGKETLMDDMSFMFQVKYRETGLSKVVPNVEDLPQDKTVEDVLFTMLTSKAVGLTEKNALALLADDGDLKVVQKLELVDSLDALYESDDAITKSGAAKLLAFLSADESDDTEIEFLNDAEKAKLVHTVQIVTLKKGFFERACKYVASAEQLRNLLTFVKATLQCSSFEFAISETPVDRAKRLESAAANFIVDASDD